MSTTRQLGRVEVERWLYHTDQGDYGPVPTDKLLEAIAERKVDLKTQVRLLGTDRWTVCGEHALFRNYYEKCGPRWAQEDAEKAHLQREASFLKSERQKRARFRIVALALLVVMGVVGYWMYRRSTIKGLGLAHAARIRTSPSLPVEVGQNAATATVPVADVKRFAILNEPDSPVFYDVAGVKVGEPGQVGGVTKLSFDENGDVPEAGPALDSATLTRVVNDAKRGIYACAGSHAAGDPSFSGTDVGFVVMSGRLGKISVGTEVRKSPSFQACVKAAVGRVSVPAFSGTERGVTIPVRIAH